MLRERPVAERPVAALAAGCVALVLIHSVARSMAALPFFWGDKIALSCVSIAPLASFTARGASFMQKQIRCPAVNDNPRLGGLFIAISMGAACAPSYVRNAHLIWNKIWKRRGHKENALNMNVFSFDLSVISSITAAAVITRICGAPASVVAAAAASICFTVPLVGVVVSGFFVFFGYSSLRSLPNFSWCGPS